MKHNHDGKHLQNPGPKRAPVRLHFEHPTATSVYVAGTFNQWTSAGTCLRRIGNGHWVGDITLAPGTYEYRLVVDGSWMADPQAGTTAPNPFGGQNSVLIVPVSPKVGHRANGMTQQLQNSSR